MSLLAMMVVSIGLAIVLRYAFQLVFGASPRVYADYQNQTPHRGGPVGIAPRDLWSIGLIIVALLAASPSSSQRTKIGKAMRAVADNRDLAASSGIDVDRVVLFVWALGGGLAALGGVLFALNERISFNSGFNLLLLMFAGITLGGLGTAYGALVGVVRRRHVHPDLDASSGVARAQERRRPGGADPRPARPPPGHPRPSGEGRVAMDWGLIFENGLKALVGTDAVVFALAAIGLNVHFGYTGLVNFGQVAFLAMGAYGVAMGVRHLRADDVARPSSSACSPRSCSAVLLGLPTLRLRADYLAIVTIAAGEIVRLVLRVGVARARPPAAPTASRRSPTRSSTSTRCRRTGGAGRSSTWARRPLRPRRRQLRPPHRLGAARRLGPGRPHVATSSAC